jgi:hypothetical protein
MSTSNKTSCCDYRGKMLKSSSRSLLKAMIGVTNVFRIFILKYAPFLVYFQNRCSQMSSAFCLCLSADYVGCNLLLIKQSLRP